MPLSVIWDAMLFLCESNFEVPLGLCLIFTIIYLFILFTILSVVYWRYKPVRALISSTIFHHSALSLHSLFQLLTPYSSGPPEHIRPISSLAFLSISDVLVSILEFLWEFCIVPFSLCVPARLSFYSFLLYISSVYQIIYFVVPLYSQWTVVILH